MRSSARKAAKAMRRQVSTIGGCDFVADPDLDWHQTPVFWRADIAADVACFAQYPESLGPAIQAGELARLAQHRLVSTDGLHLAWVEGDQALILGPMYLDQPIAAVSPVNGSIARRFAAAERLWRKAQGLTPTRSKGPSQHRRSNLTLALRALHSRLAGARHREVAAALFGTDAVPTGPAWKSSDARSRVVRLANTGRRLSEGGYRVLLGGGSDLAPP